MCRLAALAFLLLSLSTIGECVPTQHPCKFLQSPLDRSFDFTPLILPTDDYILRNEITNETVNFQLCHELHNGCNGDTTSAACLKRGKEDISIGSYPPVVNTENGSITFQFAGDPCKNGEQYTLNVLMHCDYSETDEKPALFPYDNDQCNIFISWKNKLACGEAAKTVDCKVKNQGGDVVDLSRLSSQLDNYVIDGPTNTTSIILNVCHSVIPQHGAICLADSGACLRNTSTSDIKYSNLGHVNSPKLINGTVALHYDMGKICSDASADHSQTTIIFVCDFTSHNSHPVLTSSTGCHYQLLWKTSAACSDKELQEYSIKTAEPCKITNPITNIQYNLESLKGREYVLPNANGSYKLSICGPLMNKACEPNAGVCGSVNWTTAGQANSQLLWSPTGPYLNYTNGSVCENGKRRHTIIDFTCSSGKDQAPTILTDERCYLKIQWPTPLVCEAQNVTCNPETSNCSHDRSTGTSTTAAPVTPKTNGPSVDISTTNQSITRDSSTEDKKSSHSAGITVLVLIFITLGLIGGVYLASPTRRSNLYTLCSSFVLRRTPARMAYSQVNSVEETNLLLDAPDTRCQSDSDDDLLRI